jgi:aryl-alcohol dehydrogenase-like predicted oxidoreductase
MGSKLALGTVQFGIPYGINNTSGIPDTQELELIFALANTNGINTFDTAVAYGNAEECISAYLQPNSNVISKFPTASNLNSLANDLKKSLLRLNIDRLYGFMAHDANQLLKQEGLWFELCRLQDAGLILKKGYSLYYPEQLDLLQRKGYGPDIVQIPYNLLDRRFSMSLNKLKAMGTEIHVRSVFLQGLYFMEAAKIPLGLKPIESDLAQLNELAQNHNVSMAALALNFVVQNPYFDKVVIGVEKVSQLQMNLQAIDSWDIGKDDIFREVLQLNCKHPELLIPANWK